jgi:predicted TPR repeat methyltransferase
MANPVIHPGIGLSPDQNGYLAWDPDAERLHELNAAAALIVELCDGSRTVEEIRALAAPFLPQGQAEAVDRWIAEAVEAGLLDWGTGSIAPLRELSVEELTALTEQAFNQGMWDASFRCARKVADLQPDSSDAWYNLGRMAQFADRRDEAARAYEKYLAAKPEDATIRHQLIALHDEPPPARASNECILQTFQDFSSHYDTKMRDTLRYEAPERLQELVAKEIGNAAGLDILDIGCGTGLAGVMLKPRAARLVGVDLSPEMIAHARERGIYDWLEIAEILEWLDRTTAQFDLIVACDCLVYFGDLRSLATSVARRLKPRGSFAFTVERGDCFPLELADSGRFTHHPGHLRDVAAHAGLILARLEEGFLRTERGCDVIGLLAVLKKPEERRPVP